MNYYGNLCILLTVQKNTYGRLRAFVRNYGSSVRFPSSLIVDTYECIDGKRIDESPLYDPKHPTRNRDPRFNATLAGHGDTVNYTNTDGQNP